MSGLVNLQARVRDVDLRGFVDALQPLRMQRQWRLDLLQQKLAAARKALADAEHQLSMVLEDIKSNAAVISGGLQAGIHPESYRQGLLFLVALRHRKESLDDDIVQKRAARDAICADVVQVQREIEAFELQRDAAVDDFAGDSRRRMAMEQDREWLAGFATRGQATEVTT